MSESIPSLRLVEPRPARQDAESMAGAAPLSLDELLDAEVSTALRGGIETASPELRLMLLAVIEHPQLHDHVEQIIAAFGDDLR